MEDHKCMKDKAVKEEYLKRQCPVTICIHLVSISKGQLAIHFARYHPTVLIKFVHRGPLYKFNFNSYILPGRTHCLCFLKIQLNRNSKFPVLWIMCTAFSRNAHNEDMPAMCVWLLTEERQQPVHAILGYNNSEFECRAHTLEEIQDAIIKRNLRGIVFNKEEALQFILAYNPEITFKLPK